MAYPERAALGSVVHKTKLYEHGRATRRVKELFAAQVERIVWQFKLAPETIQLSAHTGVPEIQVFTIYLKGNELHRDVLRCVDQAVQFPVIFELVRGGQTQVVAAYKRPSEADSKRWVTSEYFASVWLPSAGPRTNMPVVLHLGALYDALLGQLVPLPRRADERLSDLVARAEHVRIKQVEMERMTDRLAEERQFNRKVELNSALRQLNHELDALIR